MPVSSTTRTDTVDLSADPAVLLDEDWLQAVSEELDDKGQALMAQVRAWILPRLNDRQAASGERLAAHGAGVALILAGLQLDAATRTAGLLAALPVEQMEPRSLRNNPVAAEFGGEVARLVQGAQALIRLGQIARESNDSEARSGNQQEMLRKMLLAMAADLRIVLMRLASRLQTLRWHAVSKVPCSPEFARESLSLYAPLANRLGIWQLKWELEDLAFRQLDPVRYKSIASSLEEKRVEREAFIVRAVERVREALAGVGIEADVSGRPKHIYSIWNKMRIKKLDFSQLYDLRALRVIVADERECYTALGLVHEMWNPLPEQFDDYISRPKPNGYRSLHTVVNDEDGKPFEVQIRTREMHDFAEYGMAAHWHYKEAGARGGQVKASSQYDRQLAWMRQLLAWNTDVSNEEGGRPEAQVEMAVEDERIYVLTPQARVIDLPQGATPVDFAYHLHTDLGHRCRGARVDGQMVPLLTKLQTGQTVEIIAAKSGGPSRDWLKPQSGFLASPRARAKVRLWFNAIELQQRIVQGQALVEKELQRLGKTAVNQEQLAQQLGFARADDLYVAAAKEEFSLRQLDHLFQQQERGEQAEDEDADLFAQSGRTAARETASTQGGVLVVGVDALMTQLARCCRPAPPDAINGFVTRGRGVSIHRADCHSFAVLAERHPERVIEVAWGQGKDALYPVDISVRAQDRSGLLRDLSEVFARQRLNVVGVNTQSRRSLAHMVFTVEVRDGSQLSQVLAALAEVRDVVEAVRA